MPFTTAVAAAGNRVSNGQHVSDSGDNHGHNHNHIEEVIHSNNEHHEYPVSTGRLEQLADRQ